MARLMKMTFIISSGPLGGSAGAALVLLLLAAPVARAADEGGSSANDDILEIVVEEEDDARERERSSEAVRVVDTTEAQLESADLGEVVARSPGVTVQRTGGLGSSQRFALNGLIDHQVRFFLDGIPLDFAGFPYGLANVPVSFVERVEVYRGVVPIRFGADALGGAVNLVGPGVPEGTGGSVSLQVGSFDTLRTAGGVTHRFGASGGYLRLAGYLDVSENRYPVAVEVPGPDGRPVEATAHRFHDGYRAGGGQLELGWTDRSWGDQLSLRLYGGDFARDIQSNPSMTRPYGEVVAADRIGGGLLRYRGVSGGPWDLDAAVGASRSASDFEDRGDCIYDWFGQCVRERQGLGEIYEGQPLDQTLHEGAVLGRLTVRRELGRDLSAGASVAPSWVDRWGEDHLDHDGTWLSSVETERRLQTLVSGADLRWGGADRPVEATAFGKAYGQHAGSEDPVYGRVEQKLDRRTLRFGGGQGVRVALADDVWAKLSYEYATRLPEADEVFGDAQLVNDNLELQPEVSHNANLELTCASAWTPAGDLRGSVNLFVRDTRNQIVLLAAYAERFRYENVFEARSLGAEAEGGWTAPGSWLDLDLNGTWIDLRNRTDTGPFAPFVGDRIPNRPWLTANGTLTLQGVDVFAAGDLVRLRWHTRYVHTFFEFWESAGTADSKRTIPAQLTHGLALSLAVMDDRGRRLTVSGEGQNLTDARVYDLYGAQRPGRAFFVKTTVEL